jgi:hypothetical protein
MSECKHPGCGCFTDKGYYIQYKNKNVDSLLFVCDACYESAYKTRSQPGTFDETAYIWTVARPGYHPVNHVLLALVKGIRRLSKISRAALVTLATIFIILCFINTKTLYRTEGYDVINKIMENGFMALSAYIYMFALVSLVLFVVAVIANAIIKSARFDITEIRKLFLTNLTFMTVFALLDHFLV